MAIATFYSELSVPEFIQVKNSKIQGLILRDYVSNNIAYGPYVIYIPIACLKGCFPLGGIFRAQRNFSLFVSSQAELIGKRQRKIALRAENFA